MGSGKSSQSMCTNWARSIFGVFVQELPKVDWGNLFASKRTSGKWVAFKREVGRIQVQHRPVRVKGKADRTREP